MVSNVSAGERQPLLGVFLARGTILNAAGSIVLFGQWDWYFGAVCPMERKGCSRSPDRNPQRSDCDIRVLQLANGVPEWQ
jgi:hypothetical protein